MYKKYKALKFKLEYLLLFSAITFAFISFLLDYLLIFDTAFSRSGSIVVLLAIIVEYRIANSIYDDIYRSTFLNKRINLSLPVRTRPRKEKVIVSRVAHSLVIFGTLIWGYSDILIKEIK